MDPPPRTPVALASSANFRPGHSNPQSDVDRSRSMARTCECLTQTLSCHGCGSSVGYMIVSPCQRCTSSITVTNRTTNGHRFVFYSSEIAACERHYVVGEGGVMPYIPPSPPPIPGYPPHHPGNPTYGGHYMAVQRASSPGFESASGFSPDPEGSLSSGSSSSSSGHTTPELTNSFNTMSLSSHRDSHQPSGRRSNDSTRSLHRHHGQAPPLLPPPPPPSYAPSPRNSETPHSVPLGPDARAVSHAISAASHEPPPEPLKAGDVLYWHHLVRSGEIPGVMEDARARGPSPLTPTSVDPTGSVDMKASSPSSATSATTTKRRRFAGR